MKWRKEEAIKYYRKIDFSTPKRWVITDTSDKGWSSHFE